MFINGQCLFGSRPTQILERLYNFIFFKSIFCHESGHGSRPPSASLPTPAALKKEPDEPQHRVKLEPHSQSGGEDSTADLGVDGIKTEIDGLMDSDGKILK